jgi:hypothetical protein
MSRHQGNARTDLVGRGNMQIEMEIGMNDCSTYTLFTKTAADERIIARGISAVDAMVFIVEREPERRFSVTSEAYRTFRRFDWSLSIDQLSYGSPALHATVPVTADYEADESSALALIAVQFLRIAHHYWDGWVDTDEDFEERRQDEIDHAASLQEAERIEREIAVKFVDALTLDGYETVSDTIGNEVVLANSSDREVLLELFFDNRGMTEYTAVKSGAAGRFGIGLGRVPLDIVQSYCEAIDKLLQPIIAPYRQGRQTAAAAGDIIETPPADSIEAPGARP